jgi:hypothetical protein
VEALPEASFHEFIATSFTPFLQHETSTFISCFSLKSFAYRAFLTPIIAGVCSVFDQIRLSDAWSRTNPLRCWSQATMLMLQAGNFTVSIDVHAFGVIPPFICFKPMTCASILRLSVCPGHTSLKGSRAVIMRIANNLEHDVVG